MSGITYAIISLALSIAASTTTAADVHQEIIENRTPYTIAEFNVSKCKGIRDSDGVPYGYDQRGEYIAYGEDVQVGDTVVSLLVWNPKTDYDDDIMERYDVAVFGKEELNRE